MNNDQLMTYGVIALVVLVVFLLMKKDQVEGFADGAELTDSSESRSYYYDPRTGEQKEGDGFVDPIFGPDARPHPGVVPPSYYFLDDGAEGKMSIQHNLCSRSCCGVQFPPSFDVPKDPYVEANKDKFVPSRYFCNNSFQDSGCLCMTKDQAQFFQTRGGNM